MRGMLIRNKNILIAVFSMLLLSFSCYNLFTNVRNSLVEQVKLDLDTVAAQNTQLMEHEFKGELDTLTSLASTIPDEQHLQSQMENFKDIIGIYDLKRIGVMDREGNCYTTDGLEANLAFREFFHQSMQGKRYISKHIEDRLSPGTIINVLSVPIRDNATREIFGVLFAVYDSAKFREIFDISSFSGNGYCVVFTEKGDIVVESAKSPFMGLANIESGWLAYDERGGEYSRIILDNIRAGKSGMTKVHSQGIDKLVQYTPIRLADSDSRMFMFTVAPADALYQRLAPVANNMKNMLLFVVLIVCCLVAYIALAVYRKGKFLSDMAYHDDITGGANFAAFKKHVEGLKDYSQGYIVALDIDHFTSIEKSVDRKIVNEIILYLWQDIRRKFGENGYAARVRSDEFVVYVENLTSAEIRRICEEGCESALAHSVKLSLPVVHVVCGVYKINEGDSVELAYKRAWNVKLENKGNFDKYISFYDGASIDLENERQYMIDHFHNALKKGEFEVWYQPKIRPNGNLLAGAEALVRWRSDGRLISPGKFIPLFESNGMIAALDEYVFSKTCEQLAQWKKNGRKLVPISINVSRASLYHADIAERYVRILQRTGVSSEYVQIEITESAATSGANLEKCMREFREAGIKLLLDDFGSGYSSLASLYRLPFDVVKIDKSLTDLVEEEYGDLMIGQVIDFSKKTGKEVVAEGAETAIQVQLLERMHCDYIQGFYYSRPLPEKEFNDTYL